MIRMSVTEIDAFRYYKASEDADLEALLRRLRKEDEPSDAMLAGRALHKILETADQIELSKAEQDGFTFHFAADCEVPACPVRELKGEIVLPSPIGPVTLVGVVDGLNGAVHDHKLTARFDAERYADSYQWRCYLTMFKARQFIYQVFEAKQNDDGSWWIFGFHRLPFYAYEGMEADVQREVGEFAEFLAKHLPERSSA